jgi:hypothetical protein
MCTDLSLSAVKIIRLYGLRFKIEHGFKQARARSVHSPINFWMKNMIPLGIDICGHPIIAVGA